MMRRALSVALSMFLLSALPASAGLGSDKTAYVGGTIPALKAGTEGTSLTQERFFQFDYPGGSYEIPYTRINDLEYGQNAGRRLGLALTISPLFLLSKKRKHFLTIGFLDEKGTQQAAIFELGKNVINLTLASLEAQTGRTVTYLDEEARKGGPKEPQATPQPEFPESDEVASLGIQGYATSAGFAVTSLRAGSTATAIGINRDDIITKIDEQPVHSGRDIQSLIEANRGRTVKVTFVINGTWNAEREIKIH